MKFDGLDLRQIILVLKCKHSDMVVEEGISEKTKEIREEINDLEHALSIAKKWFNENKE